MSKPPVEDGFFSVSYSYDKEADVLTVDCLFQPASKTSCPAVLAGLIAVQNVRELLGPDPTKVEMGEVDEDNGTFQMTIKEPAVKDVVLLVSSGEEQPSPAPAVKKELN